MTENDKDPTEVIHTRLSDMNGNELRVGDLVMVMLERPILVGFVKKIHEPSILTKDKGEGTAVLTVEGATHLGYVPRRPTMFRQVAKLVNPAAEAFVQSLIGKIQGDLTAKQAADIQLPTVTDIAPHQQQLEKEAGVKTTGPSLVVKLDEDNKDPD